LPPQEFSGQPEQLFYAQSEHQSTQAFRDTAGFFLAFNFNDESQLPVPAASMMSTLGVGTPYDPTALLAQNPAPVLPSAGFRPVQSGFNFTVTNVPGPTWTQYLAGYRVEAIYGTLMLSGNLGLGVSVGSFDGKLVLGFTADPRLADVEKFKRYVSEAFDETMDLATAE